MRRVKVLIYKKNPHDISIRLRNKEHKAELVLQAKECNISLNQLMNDIIQFHLAN